MIRVYHPFNKWEDRHWGMYNKTCFMDERSLINDCKTILSVDELLYECMMFVTHNWKYSSEHNMTNTSRNRQAWLGQSACCWLNGSPEYITKIAWNELSPQTQASANKVADEVINDFEIKYNSGYFHRIWQN